MTEFKLDTIELEKAHAFINKHRESCTNKDFRNGFPRFSYIFTPTGIGVCVEIKCSKCKAEENITNYDNW